MSEEFMGNDNQDLSTQDQGNNQNDNSNASEQIDNEQVNEGQEPTNDSQDGKIPEGATSKKDIKQSNPELDKNIQAALAKMGVPKDQKYFIDKDNQIKFVMKIDGEDYAMTFDDLRRGTNISSAAHKMLNEAKTERKKIELFIERMKQDPEYLFEVAEKIHKVDRHAMAEELLRKKLRYMQMSPEEREREERLSEYEKVKAENARYKQEKEMQELEAIKADEMNKAQAQLIEAMDKHNMRNRSPKEKAHVMSLAINYMRMAASKNHPLTWEQAVNAGKESYKQMISTALSGLTEDYIGEYLTEEQVDRLLKYKNKVLSQGSKPVTPTANMIPEQGKLDLEKMRMQKQNNNNQRGKKQNFGDFFHNL